MENDLVALILRVNLALAAAVCVVLALRPAVRRYFGARVAYALWLAPLIAAAMCFAPARVVHVVLDAPLHGGPPASAVQPPYLLWAWAGGALVSLVILALRQLRFTHGLGRLEARDDLGAHVHVAQSARHGPAVIGVLRPIIVTPSDFDHRFDAEERRIVLAHERAHLAQGDPWINAIVLAVQCLNWFNPMAHIGARALRIDQELACDAAVLAQAEGLRRRYAEAMLKTHVGAAVPIGCAWPSSNLTSFKERIAMLKRTLPSRTQRLVGVGAIAGLLLAAAAVAWAAQPTRVIPTFHEIEDAATPLAPDGYTARYVPTSAAEDLEGGILDDVDYGRIQIDDGDGHVRRWEDLSPEEQEDMRETIENAREQVRAAREQIREALRDAELNAHERDEAIEHARQAAIEAQQSLEETRAEREQAVAEAAVALRDAQRQMAIARAQLAQLPSVQAAIRQAQVEVARAAAQARAEGDRARLRALERAEQRLDRAADAHDEENSEDSPDSPDSN